jgi:hypothetical protein
MAVAIDSIDRDFAKEQVGIIKNYANGGDFK